MMIKSNQEMNTAPEEPECVSDYENDIEKISKTIEKLNLSKN
jgi:hypothetical protein